MFDGVIVNVILGSVALWGVYLEDHVSVGEMDVMVE
jgi:hypothetical protein